MPIIMSKNIKDWISYGTAVFMILSGAVLCYISFFMLKEIHNSILIYLSEALTFAGAIFGVTIFFSHKFKTYEETTNKRIEDRFKEIETKTNH